MHQKLHHEEIVYLLPTWCGSVAERQKWHARFNWSGCGKQQKNSKNYTKRALYHANRAQIEDACIRGEALR